MSEGGVGQPSYSVAQSRVFQLCYMAHLEYHSGRLLRYKLICESNPNIELPGLLSAHILPLQQKKYHLLSDDTDHNQQVPAGCLGGGGEMCVPNQLSATHAGHLTKV